MNGKICEEKWTLGNKINKIDEPAYIKYNEEGLIIEENWYQYGNLFRDNNKPTVILIKMEILSSQNRGNMIII